MDTEGLKFDGNPYEKVDLSLVPLRLIKSTIVCAHDDPNMKLFTMIHKYLNGGGVPQIKVEHILHQALFDYGVTTLAVALGVGLSKYKERGNWKKFDSDPERFLKAALRHLLAILSGDTYDGETVDDYVFGNDHRGAVSFNLMVADKIINNRNA